MYGWVSCREQQTGWLGRPAAYLKLLFPLSFLLFFPFATFPPSSSWVMMLVFIDRWRAFLFSFLSFFCVFCCRYFCTYLLYLVPGIYYLCCWRYCYVSALVVQGRRRRRRRRTRYRRWWEFDGLGRYWLVMDGWNGMDETEGLKDWQNCATVVVSCWFIYSGGVVCGR